MKAQRWRNAAARALILGAGIFIAGCATTPPPTGRTTVVLMPDEDGNVGAVSISSASGSTDLTQAFSYSTATGQAPAEIKASDGQAVAAKYAELLKAQPPKPKTFILHFVLDKTVLTEQAKALLPAVLQAARERKPTEITIFGHADAIGTTEHNLKLSAERAYFVADWLRKTDPSIGRIHVRFFGEAEPLVRSSAGTPEPRNRRAEIMIL